jgi:hypothetical protein
MKGGPIGGRMSKRRRSIWPRVSENTASSSAATLMPCASSPRVSAKRNAADGPHHNAGGSSTAKSAAATIDARRHRPPFRHILVNLSNILTI